MGTAAHSVAGIGERSLRDLIERSAELKGELVAFAQSRRFDRWLTPALLEAAGPERRLSELEAIRIIDNFILRHRLPDGSTVVDKFVAGRQDLADSDREMLLGWRNPVEGIFEIRRKTCCAPTCARSRSRPCRSAVWPPPTPRRPTRSSANCCGSQASPGPEHGEELLRRRKRWYHQQEPRPGVSVIGERLSELIADSRKPPLPRARRVPRR